MIFKKSKMIMIIIKQKANYDSFLNIETLDSFASHNFDFI